MVVAMLAAIALVALPTFSSFNSQGKLDLAAAEIANALRYARNEALRSGAPHAVEWDSAGSLSLRTTTGSPPVPDAFLVHPLDKRAYMVNVNQAPLTQGVQFDGVVAPFDFNGLGRKEALFFDANGCPLYITGAGASYRLASGAIVLQYGGDQRTVRLQPATGRVTIE